MSYEMSHREAGGYGYGQEEDGYGQQYASSSGATTGGGGTENVSRNNGDAADNFTNLNNVPAAAATSSGGDGDGTNAANHDGSRGGGNNGTYSDDDSQGDETQTPVRVIGKDGKGPNFFSATPLRIRTFLLLITVVITAILSIVSISVNVFQYKDPKNKDVVISIGYWNMQVCPADQMEPYTCGATPNKDLLCSDAANPLSAAGDMGIAAIVVQGITVILLVFEMAGVVLHRTLTFRLSWLSWLFLMVQWAVTTSVYFQKKCKNTSFKEMDFKYQAGWVLPFVAWLILPITLSFLVCCQRRLQIPLRVVANR